MTSKNLFLTAAVVCCVFSFAQGQPAREAAPPPRAVWELVPSSDTQVIPLEQLGAFRPLHRWQNPDLFSVHEQRIIAALNALVPMPPAVWTRDGGFGSPFINPLVPRPTGMTGGSGAGAPGLNPPPESGFGGGFGGGGRGSR